MKNIKVFSKFLRDFNKKLSNPNLFYPNTSSKSSTRMTMVLFLLTIISFVVFCILKIYDFEEVFSLVLFMVFDALLLVDVFIVSKINFRRELKAKGNPRPKNWLKWDSDELKEIKIHTGFFEYRKVESDTIVQYIQIAKDILDNPIKNPFDLFETYIDYAIKVLLGVLFIVLLNDLNENATHAEFNSTMRLILGLILTYGLIAFVWKYMFLKLYLDKSNNEKKHLKEFIYVMQNILLLRKQKKNNGKKKNK